MKSNVQCGLVIVLWLGASLAWADSLELKNGSLIKGKFMGGTENEISFQVGSSLQKYNLADVVSLKFDSERAASGQPTSGKGNSPAGTRPMTAIRGRPPWRRSRPTHYQTAGSGLFAPRFQSSGSSGRF